jgi:hypothetical protein
MAIRVLGVLGMSFLAEEGQLKGLAEGTGSQ